MKRSGVPNLVLDPVRESLVSSAGALLLMETCRVTGLGRGLSRALSLWRPARTIHDPGKVQLDVATAVALGGDCLADVAALRAQPGVFGRVASDPTVSRVFTALAADVDGVVAALRGVRAQARTTAWARCRPLAGTAGSRAGGQVIVDIDATLVTAHSDKEGAEPTFKRGQVLVRADTGACSKVFLHHITDSGLEYSIGFQAQDTVKQRSKRFPSRPGAPRSMVTANPAMALRSPSSLRGCRRRSLRTGPHVQGRRTGLKACGSSLVANARTRVRSFA